LAESSDKMQVNFDSISKKIISEVFQKCQSELEKDPDTLTGIAASGILDEIMKKNARLCAEIITNFIIGF
jgi:uncharacterized protein YjgD (DUF1641 family)